MSVSRLKLKFSARQQDSLKGTVKLLDREAAIRRSRHGHPKTGGQNSNVWQISGYGYGAKLVMANPTACFFGMKTAVGGVTMLKPINGHSAWAMLPDFEVLSSETARKLLEAGDNNFENGDLEKALEDWEASFRLGNADAACKIATIYLLGTEGTPRDCERARIYLDFALSKHHPKAPDIFVLLREIETNN